MLWVNVSFPQTATPVIVIYCLISKRFNRFSLMIGSNLSVTHQCITGDVLMHEHLLSIEMLLEWGGGLGRNILLCQGNETARMMFWQVPGCNNINKKIFCSLRIKNISCTQLNSPLVKKADFSLIWTGWPLVIVCQMTVLYTQPTNK